ncbi:MAG: PKD domain protein [Methanocella sp. PtaU1.Bin125]|nr:MAG: PKD domain protein [Methanocella sp. PtaU1.Bin125]
MRKLIAPVAVVVMLAVLAAPALAGNMATFLGEISAVPAPVAQFSGNPLSGMAPLSVAFTDQSTGSITAWAWDFDNNGATDSTLQNPVWTYSAAGTYTVKLTVTGPGGTDDEVKPGYITVTALQKPVAAFTGTPTSGYAPLTVQFTDQSTNSPTSWKWEYKKGSGSWTQFSTDQSPSYTFTATGTYSIRLTATNAAGSNTLTKTNYITVSTPPKPVAAFTATPTSGLPPLAVQFTDQSTNNPTSWKWEYQKSGTSSWTQFSTAKNPSYTFTSVGVYSIRLTATNAGGSSTTTKTGHITVGHTGIVIAYFTGSPTSGNKPLTVQFTDGSLGGIDVWEWDFNNDGIYDSTLQNPSYTYTAKGKYSVKLRVSNANSVSTMIRYSYINVK